MEEMQKVMGAILPVFESWLRRTVHNEMERTLASEREKAKPEKTYSRDEVCAIAHISKVTLWKKEKEGAITATRIGRRVVFTESEVKRFLRED